MGDGAARRLPWGLVLAGGLLALLVTMTFRDTPARVALTVFALALGAFLVLWRLQGWLWGLGAALLLLLHPLTAEWPPPFEQALRGEALELLTLAAVAAGWALLARPASAGVAWLLVALLLIVSGALAWAALPLTGLVAGLLMAFGLPLGAVLALVRGPRPRPGNVVAACALGLLTPAAALLLAPLTVNLLGWPVGPGVEATSGPLDLLSAALAEDAAGLEARRAVIEQLPRWAWPAAWVVLPLALVGLWCALRRGRRDFRAGRPPVGWLLVLYALAEVVAVLLHPKGLLATVAVPLAALALLLAVYGVAEVASALLRPLRLLTPEERARAEVEG
jgi:hypothetical protein